MIEPRHIVIFVYIFELVAFSAFATSFRLLHGEQKAALYLARLMVVRLSVKLLYFYVEFYITSWHLNMLFNALMDTTYVLSIYLTLRTIAASLCLKIKHLRAFSFVAISYVLGFFLISLFWVDRASNHNILIQPGLPQALYSVNEVAFAVVSVFVLISLYICKDQTKRDGGSNYAPSPTAVFAGIATSLYIVYVFLWDMSFLVPGLDVIRSLKPFDGVLFFAAALAFCLAKLAKSSAVKELTAQDEAASPNKTAISENSQAEAIQQLGLTSREQEVLDELLTGKTVTQIAAELDIAENTAKRHVYNIYKKAGVHTRYELLAKLDRLNSSTER